MALFFIDTERGRVATLRQLREAGIAREDGETPAPWYRIRGTDDATTMWYAVMRRRTRGVFLGTLALRHGDQHETLRRSGWEEVRIEEIGRDLD